MCTWQQLCSPQALRPDAGIEAMSKEVEEARVVFNQKLLVPLPYLPVRTSCIAAAAAVNAACPAKGG
jgi:hypothetical protein